MTNKVSNGLICILLVIFSALSQRIAAADESTLTKVGDKSPVVSVRTIDGQDVDFHDRVVVLNLLPAWCGPCACRKCPPGAGPVATTEGQRSDSDLGRPRAFSG